MVNEVYFATPRSGSHSICSLSKTRYHLLEYFNVEDMILPRNSTGSQILYNQISQDTLDNLENGDFESAWHSQKAQSTAPAYYKKINKLFSTMDTEFPSLEQFVNEQQRRWETLRDTSDGWSVKIMRYHHLDPSVMDSLLAHANRIYTINRLDLVAQAVSILKAHNMPSNVWHSTTGESVEIKQQFDFPYDEIPHVIENILEENAYIKNATKKYENKTQVLTYERTDLSGSKYRKLNINIPLLDIDKCYSVAKKAGYDFINRKM
jgi:hypothetical protein